MPVLPLDPGGIFTLIFGLLAVAVALWTHFKSDQFINRLFSVLFGLAAVVLLVMAIASFARGFAPGNAPTAQSSAPAQTSNTPAPEARPAALPTAAPPATVEPKVHFTEPKPHQVVCKVVSVRLEGAVSQDKTLWIVVQSSGQYYVQGRAGKQGIAQSVWSLVGVNIGSTDPEDNGPYTILGIQVTPEFDGPFAQILNATHGDTGVTNLPGGFGVDPAEVPVDRQC